MYPLGLHPIGFILTKPNPTRPESGAHRQRRALYGRARHKLVRTLAWISLFGGLFALELAQVGAPNADDALAYKAAALFSSFMFLFLRGWALAALLVTSASYLGWQAYTSVTVTGGAAIVVIGISPVLALVLACLEHSQTSGRRRRGPNWMAADPFIDFCGRRR